MIQPFSNFVNWGLSESFGIKKRKIRIICHNRLTGRTLISTQKLGPGGGWDGGWDQTMEFVKGWFLV